MADPAQVAGWFDDADAFDRLTAGLWEPVSLGTLTICSPRPGERVLDACCGAGAAAVAAARIVGPNGAVDAVDVAEPLLERGRRRAAAEGLDRLAFEHADVTRFGQEAAYDLVLCVLGIFFLPDMDAGGRHLVSRLRPGGRLAVTTWAEGALDALISLLAQAAATERPELLEMDGGTHPAARVQREADLRDWLSRTGVVDVEVTRVPLTVQVDEAFAHDLLDGSAGRAFVDGLDAPAVARVHVELARSFSTAGLSTLDATTLVATGRRPD